MLHDFLVTFLAAAAFSSLVLGIVAYRIARLVLWQRNAELAYRERLAIHRQEAAAPATPAADPPVTGDAARAR
jgi:hypothetical protein